MNNNINVHDSEQYIYRPWITVKGMRIYASTYGLKAFKIRVK